MDAMGKPRSPQKKERWLLTRKTWRYMADAGRRLIPGGGSTAATAAGGSSVVTEDDLPKIEAYFQEVCAREPRFLPWRKQSYPGALGFRRTRGRRRGKGGSCRDRPSRPSSADEAETGAKSGSPAGGGLSTSTSRADLSRLRQEFLFGVVPEGRAGSGNEDGSEELLGTLQHYLYGSAGVSSGCSTSVPSTRTTGHASTLDTDALLERLKAVLAEVTAKRDCATTMVSSGVPPPAETALYEVLRRYFSKSTNRDRVISNLLTDRKKLEGLYFELRKAREFRGRGGGRAGLTFSPPSRHQLLSVGKGGGGNSEDDLSSQSGSSTTLPSSPVGIEEESNEISVGTQTRPISQQTLNAINEELKKIRAREEAAEKEAAKAAGPSSGRRSSVDNDDVSPSVSDTIKRYLRMARKKSVDSDKADRFKRVNYDRNLRNIKGKGEPSISEDDGLDKSAQTDESWVEAIKEIKLFDVGLDDAGGGESSSTASPPTSPPSHSTSFPHFLSSLLHPHAHHHSNQKGSAPSSPTTATSPFTVLPGGMHKSKSSTSVVSSSSRLVPKKIWKSRSKSQSRATPATTSTWVPKGKCTWTNVSGRTVQLCDTSLQNLSEIERRILQKVALAKLQALNLGVNVKIPSETTVDSGATGAKPKRKAYIMKRKAITTGIFDSTRNKDDKALSHLNLSNMTTPRGSGRSESGGATTGLVFGVPLNVCVENEKKVRHELLSLSSSSASSTPTAVRGLPDEPPPLLMRRKSTFASGGSRGSFSSLIEAPITPDEKGSMENLITPTLSMPGLDNISLGGVGGGSTSSLTGVSSASEPSRSSVPNLVQACLRHLEGHGLNTLGIFRVSSSKKRVRQLREDFDRGKELNLDDELCPHDVATLLKEYFRDLPDPLLCKDLYAAFIHTQRIRNRRLQHEAMQHLLQLLPGAHRDTLFSLLSFLALVASRSDDYKDAETGEWIPGNKMDSSNLATLFAPNILHNNFMNKTTKDELSQERIEERSDAINVIRSLIDNYELLFQVPAELLDEVYIHMMDSNPEALDELLSRKEPTEEPDDSIVSGDDDRKYWSRGAFTHENAATGGSDLPMRPRRMERSKERQSKKRRDESARRDEYSPRRASIDEKAVSSSGNESGRSSPQQKDEKVFKFTLKIPVPNVTSILHNLDDIPYIEDPERHHIALALAKPQSAQGAGSTEGGAGSTSESGVGSFSPPSRPPSVASSWDSVSEMPSVVSSISINPQASSSSYVKSEMITGRHSSNILTAQTERLSKSASSTAVVSSTSAVNPASISSIGGEVLRSKTADIERMIRRHSHLSSAASSSSSSVDNKRRYADSRQATRGLNLPEMLSSASSASAGSMGSGVVDTSSAAASRSVWKRRELISSSERSEDTSRTIRIGRVIQFRQSLQLGSLKTSNPSFNKVDDQQPSVNEVVRRVSSASPSSNQNRSQAWDIDHAHGPCSQLPPPSPN